MNGVHYVSVAALAAFVSALLTPLVRRAALTLEAVDRPGDRRVHATAVPRLGGLAIFAASLATILASPLVGIDLPAALVERDWRLGWLLAGVMLTVATGFVDDLRGLAPLPKLGLCTVAAAIALAGGVGLDGVTNPVTGSFIAFGALGALATLLWIVAVTNAFNLVDGLDGLAAGVALIVSLTLLAVSLMEGRTEAALLWAVLVGALLGFLPYNFHPARIFLGDSGSLLLGYLLAVLAVESLAKSATLVVVLATVLALGLPVIELVLTVLRRIAAHGPASLFEADAGHIHHRLLGQGLTHRRAVLTLYAACAALGTLAFAAVLIEGPANAVVVGVASAVIFAGIRRLHGARTRGRPS